MKWKDVVEEKPGAEFRARVFTQVAPELEALRANSPSFWSRRRIVFASVAGLTVAFIPLLHRWSRVERPDAGPSAVALLDPELLDNAELLGHLEILEDLDAIEAWDGKDV